MPQNDGVGGTRPIANGAVAERLVFEVFLLWTLCVWLHLVAVRPRRSECDDYFRLWTLSEVTTTRPLRAATATSDVPSVGKTNPLR